VANLQIRLVQTLISYEEKAKSIKKLLDKMIPLTIQAGYDKVNYIIWPEDVINSFLIEGRSKSDYMLKRLFDSVPHNGAIIFGSGRGKLKDGVPNNAELTGKDLHKIYNSLCIVDNDNSKLLDDCYDKSELIPFAEYNPLKDMVKLPNALDFFNQRGSEDILNYTKGTGKRTMKTGNLPIFSPLICYEVFFSGEVVNRNQPRPEWLLTVANDFYFRSTIGIATHLTNARFRAIEEGLPMVFVANAGSSAVIDAYGRIIKQLPKMSEGIIDSGLPIAIKPTFYAEHGQAGFFLLIFISISIAAALELTRKFRGKIFHF
jgi:apolipoprotein N-acyltransferase